MTEGAADERAWLFDILGGASGESSDPYLVRPNAESPRLLIPLASRRITSRALQRQHDDRSHRERTLALAGQAIAFAGLLRFAGGEVQHLGRFRLIDEIAERLGEPTLHAAIATGPPRRNRKPVIQLIRPDGSSAGFAKVGWSSLTKELIANEATWLRTVAGHLPKRVTAPTVLLDTAINDMGVVVTSPLETGVTARRDAPMTLHDICAIGSCLGVETRRLSELPQLEQWERDRLLDPDLIARFRSVHTGTEAEIGMWHADLTPWNTATIKGDHGGPVAQVWDWEFAAGSRPIGFDALHGLFEHERRARSGNEAAALEVLIDKGPQILRQLDQPIDACLDLYLAELIARESRLAGEGWNPDKLGRLDLAALHTLEHRLA